ncbi:asparaginyl-tRNA synthetase-like [Liolophura sinensis]|uniref:asparaginyl-tRNA synthetase-like n=1 Tax=Liolophura sinensis TaxID=3198878 RepID=UPI0031591F5C
MTRGRCWTFSRMLSERRRVSELLYEKEKIGQRFNTKGWVNSVRLHKDVVFINITDGSCLKHLQIVASPDQAEGVTLGSSVSVEGELMKSPASGQTVELKADKVTLVGNCDPKDYPFKMKERHSVDYTRGFPHLRHRTNFFSSLLRTRNSATMAIHQYFQNNGYCLVNTPVITSHDAEGAGEVFSLQPGSSGAVDLTTGNDKSPKDKPPLFFGHLAYLTVSGQLQLEAVNGGFSKVYTFGPTFRAENSRGRHHLCEFYMIEAELAFTESLEDILKEMESLVKVSGHQIMEKSAEDVEVFHKHVAPGHKAIVEKILSSEWHRIPYSDAVQVLSKKNNEFEFKVTWGKEFQKEHEHYLVSYFNNIPVFVTDFPKELKPFYARANNDGKTVSSVDLLFPGVGEVFGGSLREERLDILKARMEELCMTEDYAWYLDIRRFGSAPHGGFGMGFERFLQSLLGIHNIKDTIPFPRSSKNCKM